MEENLNAKPSQISANNANPPEAIIEYLSAALFKIQNKIELKAPKITKKGRMGYVTNAKKILKKDFSSIGWPKERVYEYIAHRIDKMIEKEQTHLHSITYKRPNKSYTKIPESQIFKDSPTEEELTAGIELRGKVEEIQLQTIKNRLEKLRQEYNDEITNIKERCSDPTRRRHPLISSIFRCINNTEKAYIYTIKAIESNYKGDKEEDRINSSASTFYTKEISKEVKRIKLELRIDPEIWLEEEFKSWLISYNFFTKQMDEIINKQSSPQPSQ